MALVREHTAYGGFYGAAEAFVDTLGYGHDALMGADTAALFGGYINPEPAAYDDSGNVWAGVGAASVLAFDRAAVSVEQEEEECDASWIDAMDQSYDGSEPPRQQAAPLASVGFDATTGCFTLTERAAPASSSGGAGQPFGLLFPSTSSPPDRTASAIASHKRSYAGAEHQPVSPIPNKKQCGAGRKTSNKAKSAPPAILTKDPQSLAAKTRRERISERLRTLQELVPNGTKVDMVTMLEKATSYVKFLQLQVKVLATDEFWPAQGGTPPEISQVREALDAILSSSQKRQLN